MCIFSVIFNGVSLGIRQNRGLVHLFYQFTIKIVWNKIREILTWQACTVVAWRLVKFTECRVGLRGLNRLEVWCYDPWGWNHRIANVHIKKNILVGGKTTTGCYFYLPDWMLVLYGRGLPPINILTTTDAWVLMSVRVWYTELTICLTVGVEHTAFSSKTS